MLFLFFFLLFIYLLLWIFFVCYVCSKIFKYLIFSHIILTECYFIPVFYAFLREYALLFSKYQILAGVDENKWLVFYRFCYRLDAPGGNHPDVFAGLFIESSPIRAACYVELFHFILSTSIEKAFFRFFFPYLVSVFYLFFILLKKSSG